MRAIGDVLCNKYGARLIITCRLDSNGLTIEVDPCEDCLEDKYREGRKDEEREQNKIT